MIKKEFLVLITFLSILAPSYSQEITIKEGDTLSKIAARYQITVRAIMDYNNLYNGDNLKAGDKLSLPIDTESDAKVSSINHKIKAGDTLESISEL